MVGNVVGGEWDGDGGRGIQISGWYVFVYMCLASRHSLPQVLHN